MTFGVVAMVALLLRQQGFCRCHGAVAAMEIGRTIYDEGWDLFGYTGYSPVMNAIIVAFKGTDSHSIYNWAENMHYWKTDYQVPFPGSEGAAVHTGLLHFLHLCNALHSHGF